MPIGALEGEVLRLLASNRSGESFVAGASVINRLAGSPRRSKDIDIFHDVSAELIAASDRDLEILRAAGFAVEMTTDATTFRRARVSRAGQRTKLEWAVDSAFRFFPVEPDVDFGWRLHFWDAATNKMLAFAGRRVFRDYVDVLYLHREHLPIAALVWAAAGKDPGLTPEFIVDWMRRTSRYAPEEIAQSGLTQPPDLRAMKTALLDATFAAEALFAKLPVEELGCLYLDAAGQPVCPDPDAPEFAQLTRHYGTLRGAWPRIVED